MFKMSYQTRARIAAALREDVGRGDVTTRTFVPRNVRTRACIEARASGILCGGPVVKEVFRVADRRLRLIQKVSEGAHVSRGKKLFTIEGRASSILRAERLALNFLGHLSGIATCTNRYVRRVRGTRAQIFDTRKTTPLWRELEKYAVRTGGGQNHRFGLWDEILVKDNHWHVMWKRLNETKCQYYGDRMKPARRKKIPIEIEVASLRQLKHILEGDLLPDRILLDHFSPRALKRAVGLVRTRRPKPKLEASGNVSLANVAGVAKSGVQRISIGALTHSVLNFDVSLTLVRS
jgi:nicotinate-nucleotide pyrophosphorylase (carboxylating)